MANQDVDHPMGAAGPTVAPNVQVTPPTELTTGINHLVQELPTVNNPFRSNEGRSRKNVCLAATPDAFDGNKANYRKFLRQLKLFMTAYAKEFDEDEAKIVFVLSLMKEGTAELWAQTYTDQVIDNNGYYGSWATFQEELNKSFVDYEENKRALQRLNALVQGRDSAADYFTKFEQHAKAAGVRLHEDVQVISQVEHGLNPGILDKIYASGEVPYSYENYRIRAVAIDELWRRRQEMKQPEAKTRPVVRDDWRNRGKPRTNERVVAKDPNAMEVDASRAKQGRNCYLCGSPEHIMKDCTKRLQNRAAEVTDPKDADEEKPDF